MKSCSTSLVIKETQIKTTLRFPLTTNLLKCFSFFFEILFSFNFYYFQWKIKIMYIYGIQCDILIYSYIVERFNQAYWYNHHFNSLYFFVMRILQWVMKTYSFNLLFNYFLFVLSYYWWTGDTLW
jgi:hypothetical protein